MFTNLKENIKSHLATKGCSNIRVTINNSNDNPRGAEYVINIMAICRSQTDIFIRLYANILDNGNLESFFSRSNPRSLYDNRFEEILNNYNIYDDDSNFEEITNNINLVLTESNQFILLEVQCTINNKIYTIHKNDADPYPSNPHAHVGNKKVHLGTGEYFQGARATGTYLQRKEFERLRRELTAKGIELP